MADENKDVHTEPPLSGPFRIVPSNRGVSEFHANYIDLTWTLYDLRICVCSIIPARELGSSSEEMFVAKQDAAVTMSWHQAKHLRNLLSQVIEGYEQKNGELKPIDIP